jgi:hypothetical protein
MYKSADEKLVLGPLWDFDHALGNDGGEDNFTTGWAYSASPWAGRLYDDRGFRRKMAKRWKSLRKRGLRRHLERTIDRGARQLAAAQQRNFSRWPIFGTRTVQPPDPRTGAPPANHAEAVDYLKWWVVKRYKWINRNVNTLGP